MPFKTVSALFAANLAVLVGGDSVNNASKRWRVPQTTLNTLILGTAKDPRLSTIEAVAQANGLQAWQLLAGPLDLLNPPTLSDPTNQVASTPEENALLAHFRSLSDEDRRAFLRTLRIDTDKVATGEVPAAARKRKRAA